MASSLRLALILLAWGLMAVIGLPLLPAASLMIAPALSLTLWQDFLADPQLPQAMIATLVSTVLAMAGALAIALTIVAAWWPSRQWQRLSTRLPLLLAVPHVAFATAALLLFAEGGLWYQVCRDCTPWVDRYGIGLGVTLAVKESGFLLWVIWTLMGEKSLAQQALVLRTQGYGRWQCLAWLILPRLLPQLTIVLLAATAWTLSVVDVAVIIGPGNPPTLAVLAAQWLAQGDELQQAKGALASLCLLMTLAILVVISRALWRLWQKWTPDFLGVRRPSTGLRTAGAIGHWLPLCGVACAAVLWWVANGNPPETDGLTNSLLLGVSAAFLGLGICLLWLECGPSRDRGIVWLPLILPALPLAAGQYQLALMGWLDGQWLTVLWGHLLWVAPWMLFILRPAWQRLDPRLILIARTFGWSRGRIFWLVKCPLLARPLLSSLAVGFSVSVAQYLPTLWLGAGRIVTLTTETVALSSSGVPATLAAQALWQMSLPVTVFLLIGLLLRGVGHCRQGLR